MWLLLTQEELGKTPGIYMHGILPDAGEEQYLDGTPMPYWQQTTNARIRLLIRDDGVELPFDISYDELNEAWKLRDAATRSTRGWIPKPQKNAALIEAIRSLL